MNLTGRPYATLFITWLAQNNGYFQHLLQKRVNPEIGLEYGGFDLALSRHRETAAIIKDHGLRASIHLPYSGIRPGADDKQRRESGRDLLLRALEISAIYEPDHLIGHPEFRPGIDSVASIKGGGPGNSISLNAPNPMWLEASSEIWGEALKHTEARLYLENTSDKSPAALMALLGTLPPQAAMCFDIGHWFCAADGKILNNLAWWMEQAAPRLAHLHLHDNHGYHNMDEHLGMGRGLINFQSFNELLILHNLKPTYTLEAHNADNLDASLNWLNSH